MSRLDESTLRRRFLRAYEPELVPHIVAFAARLSTLPSDVIMTMARKATCLVDAMIQLGYVQTDSQITSDRVLDMDLAWLRDRRVALVDDLIVSGTTLCRTVDRLSAAGASDVSVHAIVVDDDWWSPQLVQPLEPYVTLNDSNSMAFCNQTIKAINTLPRPYNIDWPLYTDGVMSDRGLDCLGAIRGWRARDVTSTGQWLHGIVTITCEAAPTSVVALDQRCGWATSEYVELAKVRVFAQQEQDQPHQYAIQALPIVTFTRMSVDRVNSLWTSLTDRYQFPTSAAAEFVTIEGRLRLIQYLAATELGRLWTAAVKAATGVDIGVKLSENQLSYMFPPHIAGLVAHSAKVGGRSLPLPQQTRRAPGASSDQNRLPSVPALGFSAAAVQARLTEPFRRMYEDDELPARRLVLQLGRHALNDKNLEAMFNRLNRGLSLAQLEKLAREMPVVITARQIVSTFLDFAIDHGVAVPITVADDTHVWRAFRHGEDVLSTDTDWRLYGLMLRSLAEASGLHELPSTVVESALSIFIRLGVRRGLLTMWHGQLGATGTLGSRFGIGGVNVRIDSSSLIDAASGRGLVDVLVTGGVLRRTRRRSFYSVDVVPESGATTRAQDRDAMDIGWLLGRLLSEEPDQVINSDELNLLAYGANKLDMAFALAPFVAAASLLISVLTANTTSQAARRGPSSIERALRAVDKGLARYQELAGDSTSELMHRVSQNLRDPLYRHQWLSMCEQLGAESQVVTHDLESRTQRLGVWLRSAAASLRIAKAALLAGGSARRNRHGPSNQIESLRREAAELLHSLPIPLPNALPVAADAGAVLPERAEAVSPKSAFRLLVSDATALLDEIRASATSYGAVRVVERFTAALVINAARSSHDEDLTDERIYDCIEGCRRSAAESGILIDVIPNESVSTSFVVAGSGDDSAAPLGKLAVDLCNLPGVAAPRIALVPHFPPPEHLFRGRGSFSHFGTSFWKRVQTISRLLTELSDGEIVLLTPPGATDHQSVPALSSSSLTRMELPADGWSAPCPWVGVTTKPRTGAVERTVTVGVITILAEETGAVVEVLKHGRNFRVEAQSGGRRFYHALVGEEAVRVVATQTSDHGQRAAAVAFEQLHRYCEPEFVVVVGIAGGIHPAVTLGDVVVALEVIYYDARRETSTGTTRRIETHRVPVSARHAINAFFSHHGDPFLFHQMGESGDIEYAFKVLSGPIGSGEAVVSDSESDIRQALLAVNDKTLALETEAGAIAQTFYEEVGAAGTLLGWLAIRGISDHGDEDKDDSHHLVAARNAATVLKALLPFLELPPSL